MQAGTEKANGSGGAAAPEVVRAQLEKVLGSKPFAASERMQRFLRYVVEQSLAGNAGQLKEYALGVEVFDRGAGFDPRTDSIVRVEATRLRGRLKEYYEAEGRDDAIRIEVPRGSYVPVVRLVTPAAQEAAPAGEMLPAARGELPPVEHALPRQRAVLAALFLLLAAGIAASAWWLIRPARVPFQEKDWALIAQFENRTGEPVFDGALEHALQLELSNSSFVRVVPRERVDDALALMKRAPGSVLDRATAREVCLRDGGIRVLVAGRVARFGQRYSLDIEVVDPQSGATVAAGSEEAASQDAVLTAVRRLSGWLRHALGEQMPRIAMDARRLEKVATPSLAALHLYSKAISLAMAHDWVPVEHLLVKAVEEDPEFASAHIFLAWARRNTGKPRDQWDPHRQRALELAAGTTERERYFIIGSSYLMNGDTEKAIAPFEALVRLDPGHFWANTMLADLYRFRDCRRAVAALVRVADARPRGYRENARAAAGLARCGKDFRRARLYAARALEGDWPGGFLESGDLQLLDAYEHWAAGRLMEMERELHSIAAAFPAPGDNRTDEARVLTAAALFGLGQMRQARELAATVTHHAFRYRSLAVSFYLVGNQPEFRRYAAALASSYPSGFSAVLLLRAGHVREAAAMLERIPAENAVGDAGRGELALLRGQTDEAIRLLTRALNRLDGSGFVEFYFAVETLARAYAMKGETALATKALEQGFAARHAAFPGFGHWLRIAFRLSQAYRKAGRIEQARRIEAELRTILAHADPGHPVAAALASLPEAASPAARSGKPATKQTHLAVS